MVKISEERNMITCQWVHCRPWWPHRLWWAEAQSQELCCPCWSSFLQRRQSWKGCRSSTQSRELCSKRSSSHSCSHALLCLEIFHLKLRELLQDAQCKWSSPLCRSWRMTRSLSRPTPRTCKETGRPYHWSLKLSHSHAQFHHKALWREAIRVVLCIQWWELFFQAKMR